ncbi:MAG: hypothetical protein IT245_07045 [Bacteroidia bacterium]|nr:hypothetical protein [Bacteroidia bacterium]
MKTINLHLRAKHFIDTCYLSNEHCAVAKAAKELFPNAVEISENTVRLRVDNTKYKHECYSHQKFITDKKQVIESPDLDPNTIIRTIVLTEQFIIQ